MQYDVLVEGTAYVTIRVDAENEKDAEEIACRTAEIEYVLDDPGPVEVTLVKKLH